MLGGAAKPRGARLAARYADEYNVLGETPESCRERRDALDRACEAEGRDPESLPMSVMVGFVIGADEPDLRERRARMAQWRGSDRIRPDWLCGTVDQVRERLAEYAAAGVKRVMFQHRLFRDLGAIAL